MNKNVLISIKGMHFQNNLHGDNVEVIQPGHYYERDGMHYLVYDEPVEGTDKVGKNMIKFNDKCLLVTKTGPYSSNMLFDEKEKNLTNYNTPFGAVVLGIDTHKVQVMEEPNRLSLNVQYSLDVNYEFLADCNIHIEATNMPS